MTDGKLPGPICCLCYLSDYSYVCTWRFVLGPTSPRPGALRRSLDSCQQRASLRLLSLLLQAFAEGPMKAGASLRLSLN